MAIITIDSDLCTQCGLCVTTCPETIFVQRDPDATPETDHEERCVACGHCAAICPHGAVRHSEFPEGSVQPLRTELMPAAKQVTEMLRARRSLRVFKDQPVERALVEQVIGAGALAPSAHNTQSTQFTVVDDPIALAGITELAVSYYAKAAKQLRNPVVRALIRLLQGGPVVDTALHLLPDLDMVVEATKHGRDLVLRGAPCLIVGHAPDSVHYPEANAMLVLHNAALMAQALGLGGFLVGYVVGACERDRRIPQLLDLPKGHRVRGALALGYPAVTFDRWIKRRPPQVRWL